MIYEEELTFDSADEFFVYLQGSPKFRARRISMSCVIITLAMKQKGSIRTGHERPKCRQKFR